MRASLKGKRLGTPGSFLVSVNYREEDDVSVGRGRKMDDYIRKEERVQERYKHNIKNENKEE